MTAGKIKNVGETYTDGWKPDNAQKKWSRSSPRTTTRSTRWSSRTTAWRAASSPRSRRRAWRASVPVSGQDGDHAAINRVALGTQTVSIWKDARDLGKVAGEAAVALADGKKERSPPTRRREALLGRPEAHEVDGILLTPLAVTKDNLNVIVDKGWITKAEVCAGVKPEMTPYCK